MTYPVAASAGNNSKATTALVLGILSLVCCGLFTGIPAIFVGRAAEQECLSTGQQGAGMAKAGWILGIIGTVLSVLGGIARFTILASN